ncbi:MAG: hypothetical protein Q9167_005326 [Letrouitia subvulpina]
MEALAAASGVVGIITFASKALFAIDGLKEVCGEFSEEGTKQLFHDLDVTNSILLHAKELAEQIQLQETDLRLEYRARALQIQIDDCAQDLETWLRTARRLSGIDLAMTGRLQRLEKASEDQCGDAKDLSKRFSDLSSSISSSTNSIQVQNSETSRKLDTITELLHQLALKSSPLKAQEDTRNGPEGRTICSIFVYLLTQQIDVNQAPDTSLVPSPDIEFELLYRVFASMTNTLRHLYTPQVSELLTTMFAWRTIEYYEACARLKPMPDVQISHIDKIFTSRELERLHRHVARQLFATRKRFFSEGLGETFDDIVESMKMEHLWSKANLDQIFGTHSLRKRLASYQPLNTLEEREERLTRINEWLLGVFKAQEYHVYLYCSIFEDTFKAAPRPIHQFWYRWMFYHPEYVRGSNGISSRLIMKYWFLDAAATLRGEAATPSTMCLSDSDATFRPLEIESTKDLQDLENLEDREDWEDFCPETTQLRTSLLRDCSPDVIWWSASVLEQGLTDLPDSVSEEEIHQATGDLEAYQTVSV